MFSASMPQRCFVRFDAAKVFCSLTAGDTVLDPFMGTGTTNIAASKWGRNSIGFEIDQHYFDHASSRMKDTTHGLFSTATLCFHDGAQAVEIPRGESGRLVAALFF